MRNKDLMTPREREHYEELEREALSLSSAEREVLRALIHRGPLFDGDVPSKFGRDSLVRKGLAAKIVVKFDDGYQAATCRGCAAYCMLLGVDTLNEAKEKLALEVAVDAMKRWST